MIRRRRPRTAVRLSIFDLCDRGTRSALRAAVRTVERSTFKDFCSNDLAERPAGRLRRRICTLFQLS
jgi:hypothetical protein